MAGEKYVFYSGLVGAEEIFDKHAAEGLKHIFFIGDDMQGVHAGFHAARDWSVVEVDSATLEVQEVVPLFGRFLMEHLVRLLGG